MSPSRRLCRYLTAYLTGDLDEPTLEAFERHVPRCRACQEALAEVMPSWQMLVDVEPSAEDRAYAASWQKDILAHVLGTRSARRQRAELGLAWRARRDRVYQVWAYAASALAVAASFGLVVMAKSASSVQGPPANAIAQGASTPIAEVPMQAMGNGAEGRLYVFRQGKAERLVIVVEGLKPVSAPGAYSVWYVHGDVHDLAATLRVDAHGTGIAMLPYPPKQAAMVGITREPDAKDVRPRGKRVLIAKLPKAAL
ncbi:anti-sigma factor [Alicyclobacillus vulcanalis]|uniref:Anti-sigma-K factor rskA n=1 Tax=Alicyclobacillus vulcanalis TaxID=252246 RepID=A0A1N7PGD6_9BACL|nr:anti-sigma factor [Alicyclobacillus vulcanalis]SIT09713.1 Anti-sigma-K factor rskA [Alicyclobacillus vulcanalis]